MAKKTMSIRDELRAITVGSKKDFTSKTVKFKGKEFEIRQPSIKDRKNLRKYSVDENGDWDVLEALMWMVIFHTYVPGTNERVFEEQDYEELSSMPTGGFIDAFAEVAAKLLNVDAKALEKNS